MATKHDRKTMTQQERAFWRDAFLAAELPTVIRRRQLTPEEIAEVSADFADAAVAQYRNRITWRQP